jgi:hypothetical protein
MTYNVAGLPSEFSASNPSVNSGLISPLLNDYDIVVVQEDFGYHPELAAEALHEYQDPPFDPNPPPITQRITSNRSGLSRFSRHPIDAAQRVRWNVCNGLTADGSDCLAPKGYSVGLHSVDLRGRIVGIDVYNLHMDAGDSDLDRAARAEQVQQLIEAINTRSAYKPTIVAGDTNLDEFDEPLLTKLLLETGLSDACVDLGCPDVHRIDRILYKGTEYLSLVPMTWRIPEEFVDEEGRPLSDHNPVVVDFYVGFGSVYQGFTSDPYADDEIHGPDYGNGSYGSPYDPNRESAYSY